MDAKSSNKLNFIFEILKITFSIYIIFLSVDRCNFDALTDSSIFLIVGLFLLSTVKMDWNLFYWQNFKKLIIADNYKRPKHGEEYKVLIHFSEEYTNSNQIGYKNYFNLLGKTYFFQYSENINGKATIVMFMHSEHECLSNKPSDFDKLYFSGKFFDNETASSALEALDKIR